MEASSKIEYTKEDIVSVECKFIVHLDEVTDFDIKRTKKQKQEGTFKESRWRDSDPPDRPRPDIHIVKEWINFKDGTRKPNLRIIKDFKKPFWITKTHHQNHKQKKEAEEIEKLNRYSATESGMGREVAMRLGNRYVGKRTLRDVRDNPFVYGLDISSKAYINKMYKDKFDVSSPYTVCVLDIEENMIRKEVNIVTVTMRDKSFTAVLDTWVKGGSETIEKINYLYNKHVPKTPYTKNIKREYGFFKTEIELVQAAFKKLHEWQPDLVEVWNIGYDVPRMVKVCKDAGVKPKDVFSDPFLPKEYRYFKYREGKTHSLTEAGVFKPMDLHQQWHTVDCPSTFFFVDGMSAYHYIRIGGKKVPTGYGLDSILTKELGAKFQKLKFQDGRAEKLVKLAWHNYMVEYRPLEYIVYNNYDTIGPLILDDKTKDLQVTMPMLIGYSPYEIFDSGPKRIVEALHFFCLDRGLVMGSKPNVTSDDKKLGLKNWIVTLASSRIKDNGMKCVEEGDHILTSVRGNTMDADQVSGYPSDGQAANVSKDTTTKELLAIAGIPQEIFMKQNINLFFGKVNSLEYCNVMHNMPTLFQLYVDVVKYQIEEKAA